MERLSSVVRTTDQQFGFKRNHSCADCSFVLKNTIDYYLDRVNSRMYVCALNLSNAYDRVPYYRLFCRLLDCSVVKLPPLVTSRPWNWPSKPFQRIHVDFAGPFMGHVIADYFCLFEIAGSLKNVQHNHRKDNRSVSRNF